MNTIRSYKEEINNHDFFDNEHITRFLRNHGTGVDNLGRQKLGQIIKTNNYYTILDIACGSCVSYEAWKLMGINNIKYTGFDLTQKLLDEAYKRYNNEVILIKGYAQEINKYFGSNSQDCVIIRHFLEHVPNGEYKDIINRAINIASKELILVFFLEPHGDEEDILEKRGPDESGCYYWWNQYSWIKLVEFLSGLNVQLKIETVSTPGASHQDFICRLIK